MTTKNYRWDIQGLRALAVMAVVIFHIESAKLPGGYLGVDIFFVISGYLIIGFIWRDISLQKFTLANFYTKRIKRLFPALFVTVLATIIAGYFFLLPEEIQVFAKSVISTLLYISNMFFYTQSDYFAADLELAPLLHTWSLSVEEQFYIIFPLLLLGVARWSPHKLQITLAVVAVISFVLSEYLVYTDPSLSFFISPTRFWQFIVGGLLALNIHKFKISALASNIIGSSGLLALIYCLFTYTEKTLFPGISAIVPTFSTLLVLLAGNTSSLFSRIMALPINRFLGNISYSLYLWHWPVIVFYGLAINNQYSTMINNVAILLISLVLGYLSWKFIEQPFTKKSIHVRKKVVLLTSLGTSAAVILLMLYSSDGLPNRFNEKQLYFSSFMNYHAPGFRGGKCFLSSASPSFKQFDKDLCVQFKPEKYNILLLGDSHAAHWNSALTERLGANQTLTQVTASGCRPVMPFKGRERCVDTMNFGIDLISQYRFDKIILASRWDSHDLEMLDDTVRLIMQQTDELLVVGRTLEYYQYLPRVLAMNGLSNIKNDIHNRYSYLRKMDLKFVVLSNEFGFKYLSLIDALCSKEQTCRALTKKGVPIAFDYGHFTHEGALSIVKQKIDMFLPPLI